MTQKKKMYLPVKHIYSIFPPFSELSVFCTGLQCEFGIFVFCAVQ
jgi:hypothetical protein